MVGQTLGHYRVLELLGKGGMGEVYQAEDTTLGREVAIKVLPQEFTEDPERLARFEREAKLLATLNHPHIAQIFALEEVDGQRLLVMELVEGETLSERLARGSLPVEDALPVALQITHALEAAHERGIVHRDLKPGNIKLTPGGEVKVLDFGLAKPITDAASGDLSHSPTLTYSPTRAGVLLGTASYMSPEQARGQEVDRRTDIWSFGVVLWEILTGRHLFDGETVSDILAGVLKEELSWERLPADLPPPISRVLHRCLTRDPKERLHDIADARLEIEEAIAFPERAPVPKREPTEPPTLWNRLRTSWWALPAAILIGAFVVGLAWWLRSPELSSEAAASSPVHRAAITVPDSIQIESFPAALPILTASPDGRWLVFVARENGSQQLFKRPLDQNSVIPILGSENAAAPFSSPDSEWVAFFDLVEGKLKKVNLDGGSPIVLADTPNPFGGTWGPNGVIVFNPNYGQGLWQVAESGGQAEPLLLPNADEGITDYINPSFLPDGKAVLFSAWRGGFTARSDDTGILDLESGEISILLKDAEAARYVASGHLLFVKGDHVEVVPFDLETNTVEGPVTPIPDPVTVHPSWGYPDMAITRDGTLAFLPGSRLNQELVEVDIEGNSRAILGSRQPFARSRYSPDGGRLVVSTIEAGWPSISVIDLDTGIQTRLAGDGKKMFPVWSPDGESIAFSMETSDPPASWSVFSQRVRGGDQLELLVSARESGETLWPYGWTPRGRELLIGKNSSIPWRDEIWLFSFESANESALVADAAQNNNAVLSPDGQWLAYLALEQPGGPAIYVQQFPESTERHRVSTGSVARIIDWSPDGERLYFAQTLAPKVAMEWRETTIEVMEVQLSLRPTFKAGTPRQLFQGSFATAPWSHVPPEDLSPDGTSFIMIKPDDDWRYPGEIRVIFNWFEELERLAPTSGN